MNRKENKLKVQKKSILTILNINQSVLIFFLFVSRKDPAIIWTC